MRQVMLGVVVLVLVGVQAALAEPMFEKTLLFKRPTAEDHYRGPRLCVTRDGRIIASAILKVGHMRDTGGSEHDEYVYSDDNGKTWKKTTDLKPGVVVDQTTGNLFAIDRFWPMNDADGKPMTESWMINHPQEGIKLGAWAKISCSSDGGKTWEERDVTQQLFTYTNGGLAWFIGTGLQLQRGPHAGRLIITGRHFGKEWDRCGPDSHNTLIYSDDHGQTWQWGGDTQGFSGEACTVELADGSIYMNNRNHNPDTAGYRSWDISHDGGQTFTEHGVAEDLPEPRCHASMVRYNFPDPDKNEPGRVLFLNPAVSIPGTSIAPKEGRRNMTVHVSYDDCRTWPLAKTIHADKGGYSDIAIAPDGTVLCVFETGEEIYAENIMLVRFNLEWLESQ